MKLRRDGAILLLLLALLLAALAVGRGINHGAADLAGRRRPAGATIPAGLSGSALPPSYAGDFRYVRLAAGGESLLGPILLKTAEPPDETGAAADLIPTMDLFSPTRPGGPLGPTYAVLSGSFVGTGIAAGGFSPAGIDFPNIPAGTDDETPGGGYPIIIFFPPGGFEEPGGAGGSGGSGGDSGFPPVVPLPGTLLLFGTGLGGLVVLRKVRAAKVAGRGAGESGLARFPGSVEVGEKC